ncbi:MAG: zinc ribbon domain-containing protein [Phycisphaerales bacterium JB037]
MTVTDSLLKVFQVDEQIEGLRSRLTAAERFLKAQSAQVDELTAKKRALESQLRQLSATAADREGEADTIQARIDKLRAQMNEAKTNKEYQAFLVEVNTLKADKSKIDSQALEQLEQIDALKAEIAGIDEQVAEKNRIVEVARSDRDQREAEIRDRLNELEGKRDALADSLPGPVLQSYRERRRRHEGDEVMAPVEVQDFRRHEFTCGSCMMNIPMEIVMSLLTGQLNNCSCGVFLYLENDLSEKLSASARK